MFAHWHFTRHKKKKQKQNKKPNNQQQQQQIDNSKQTKPREIEAKITFRKLKMTVALIIEPGFQILFPISVIRQWGRHSEFVPTQRQIEILGGRLPVLF